MSVSGKEWGDWLEGYLFDRRIAVVRGPLDDLCATRVATQLMTLDATGDEPVTLQIDSEGGPLTAGFTLIDVIDSLGVPVNVLCMGRVEGVAVAVAAAASHRLALAHTQFRLSDPCLSFEASASEAARIAERELGLLARYHECLSTRTGRSVEEVERWCAERRFLDAAEAKAAGIVDEISHGKAPLRRVR
ncbi:MAG TPA: ATP-dependent Clp protease proteolytic subunit [Acidimicrobiales bacterium]|nr:ATP-dependent Clp protease proteolytic subunit [Acidimicrobiales bacterium]